jgi:hypothetical protein
MENHQLKSWIRQSLLEDGGRNTLFARTCRAFAAASEDISRSPAGGSVQVADEKKLKNYLSWLP